jgi:hypothetical protein
LNVELINITFSFICFELNSNEIKEKCCEIKNCTNVKFIVGGKTTLSECEFGKVVFIIIKNYLFTSFVELPGNVCALVPGDFILSSGKIL